MLYDEMTYIVHNKRATYGHSSKIYFEKRDLVNSGMLCSLRIVRTSAGEELHDMMAVTAVDDEFLFTRQLNVILDGTLVILHSDLAHYYLPKRFHIPRSDQLSPASSGPSLITLFHYKPT